MNLIFFTHYGSMLGANRSMVSLIKHLQEYYQFKILVICREEGEIIDVFHRNNINFELFYFENWCYKIKKTHSKTNIVRSGWRMRSSNKLRLRKLSDRIKYFNPNWIISNSSVFDFGYMYAKHMKYKHLWIIREFGKEDYGIKFFNPLRASISFNYSDLILAISKSIASYYKRKYIIIKNIHIIYNGLFTTQDLELIEDTYKKSPVKQLNITYGILGVIKESKGQYQAVEAFKILYSKYPNCRLIIAGPGERAALSQFIHSLNLEDQVTLIDYAQNPFEILSQIDINLVCSKKEGLGRTTIEAMALGIPTIGLDSGGTSEIIQNNINGLLYQKTKEDLASKMLYLYENPNEIDRLGMNAKKSLEQNFMMETYSRNFISLLLSKE